MKIVCDDKIPFIRPALSALADELVMLPGAAISAADVHDATILVVRTRTRCDRRLLEGSSVRLIVTATIGYDHLDVPWLCEAGIHWSNCPGCNATSVAQYVHSSLLVLAQERGLDLTRATIGVIGVGHVGTAVTQWLHARGIKHLLLCDPPLEEMHKPAPMGFPWSSQEQVLAQADIITLHTPLTLDGPHATFHMAGTSFLDRMRQGSVLINAARGGIVDEEALLKALYKGHLSAAIIDTWEKEPHLNRELLKNAFIATPHIAGYSADGKANATRMTISAICAFLSRPMTYVIEPPALPSTLRPAATPEERSLQLYDPRADHQRLLASPDAFEHLRGTYPLRRESFER